jgi:hypothetical protein
MLESPGCQDDSHTQLEGVDEKRRRLEEIRRLEKLKLEGRDKIERLLRIEKALSKKSIATPSNA